MDGKKACRGCGSAVAKPITCNKCNISSHPGCLAHTGHPHANGIFVSCSPPTASHNINTPLLNNIKELLKIEFEDFKKEMRELYLVDLKEIRENLQCLSHRVDQLENLIEGSQPSFPMDRFEEQMMAEMEDRVNRSKNIIFFDLEENNNGVTTDVGRARDILNIIVPGGNLPLDVMRLGKRQQGRHRPLRISLPSKQDVIRILRNKSRYSGPVRMVQDQTLKQRAYLKDIQARLKALKDAGVNNKTIRFINGMPKIVDVGASAKSKN